MSDHFTGARALAAEGARIAFVTCELCGAAICIDPADQFSPIERHKDWHALLGAVPESAKP